MCNQSPSPSPGMLLVSSYLCTTFQSYPQLCASSWTLSSLLMAWVTLLYLSGSQLKLFPQEAIVKKTQDSVRCWQGCGTTGLSCWWEYKLIQPLWKTTWQYLLKLNIHLPYDSVVLYPLYIPNRNAYTCAPKDMLNYVCSKIKYNNTNSKQSKCPFIKDRMDMEMWNGHAGPTLCSEKWMDYCYIQ